MGTTYSVQAFYPLWIHKSMAQASLDEVLDKVNASMSTYDPTSEISMFNASKDLGYKDISDEFYSALTIGERLFNVSTGAWDGTVDPFIKLWGFDNQKRRDFPDIKEINRLKEYVGFSHLSIRKNQLKKDSAFVGVNLSSVAKGYAVDLLKAELIRFGVKHAFIEIGGEISVVGTKPNGKAWRVGIQKPIFEEGDDVYGVINMSDMAMATSGDYRQYFDFEGVRYSHIIDPRTGYPIKRRIASATVLAKSCAFADGLATAFMVMDPSDSMSLVESLDDVELCLILYSEHEGFEEQISSGFVFSESRN
jgi:FAD:protein FMN transferase